MCSLAAVIKYLDVSCYSLFVHCLQLPHYCSFCLMKPILECINSQLLIFLNTCAWTMLQFKHYMWKHKLETRKLVLSWVFSITVGLLRGRGCCSSGLDSHFLTETKLVSSGRRVCAYIMCTHASDLSSKKAAECLCMIYVHYVCHQCRHDICVGYDGISSKGLLNSGHIIYHFSYHMDKVL